MSLQLERKFLNKLWTFLYATIRKLSDFADVILAYKISFGRDTAGRKLHFMQEIYLHLMFGLSEEPNQIRVLCEVKKVHLELEKILVQKATAPRARQILQLFLEKSRLLPRSPIHIFLF